MAAFVANLGPYVYLMNPYVATPLPSTEPQDWNGVSPVILGPPGAPAVVAVPPGWPPRLQVDTLYGLCLDEVEAENYYGTWEFRETPRKVVRALRIPYMYYKASANLSGGASAGATLVKEHLLIGYEGMGGGN